MKMNNKDQRELHAMLDEALDRVLKGEDVNIVLADYPRFAEEFTPLLRTAIATHKAADLKPRPEFRQRAALEFQKALQAMPVKNREAGRVSRWRLAWVMPVAVFATLLISGSSIVVASNSSLPGSPLYSVKLAAENVQMALTPSSLGKAELYAKFNDRRVDELVAIAADTEGLELTAEIDTLNTRIASNMNSISELTGGVSAEASSNSMSIMAVPEHSKGGLGYNDTSAATMTTTATKTMTTTITAPQAVASTTTATVTPATTVPPVTTKTSQTVPSDTPLTTTTGITIPPATSADITPDAVPGETYAIDSTRQISAITDEEQALIVLLTEKQQENLAKLEAAWEKAPDWLKPLLRQAIELIIYGYDTSISNLAY